MTKNKEEDLPQEPAGSAPAADESTPTAAPPKAPGEGPDEAAEQQSKKLSPGDAFRELTASVDGLYGEVDAIGSFVRRCKEKLFREADEHQLAGMKLVLESLFRIHDLVLRQIVTMESGRQRPDSFIINLFETVGAELHAQGVEVVFPQPGEEVKLEVMTTIGTAPCSFWRKQDTVAQVSSCGYVLNNEFGLHVLRKAEVTVARRKGRIG